MLPTIKGSGRDIPWDKGKKNWDRGSWWAKSHGVRSSLPCLWVLILAERQKEKEID